MELPNPNLPANHQGIDNIPEIDGLSLDGLGELYENYQYERDHIDAGMVEVKKTIYEKQTTDSARAGKYLSLKTKKALFPDLSIEKADELGLTKIEKKIDTKLVNKAHKNGADLGKVEWKTGHQMRQVKEEVSDNG